MKSKGNSVKICLAVILTFYISAVFSWINPIPRSAKIELFSSLDSNLDCEIANVNTVSDTYKAPDNEINRRRNFAIISHPDAGKTTLTEKLLLFGGAIQDAGAVKARADQRKATSDWYAFTTIAYSLFVKAV